MADEGKRPIYRRMTSELRPGEPLRVSDPVEIPDAKEMSPLCRAMAATLKAYSKAARELLEGQYANVRELAPPQLRVPCHAYVLCCPDGVLVRYDAAGEEEPKIRHTDYNEALAEVAPKFSEQVIHVPDDPATYVPTLAGPVIIQAVINQQGEEVEHARLHPIVYAPKALPSGFNLPPPPARPPCLAALNRELQIQVHGVVLAANTPARAIPSASDNFIAHGLLTLPVGWEAIEIYPRLGEEYWRPEYASGWAQVDLLSVIAQHNAMQSALHRLDGRRAAREHYIKLLDEFETLLAGPEKPCHQFLKAHPDLLCSTYDAAWSKVRFGKYVSDFVFREPHNDYTLVEIEAPFRELFRKDGHPRQELTHAMSQIEDWLKYLQDHKIQVETELGLHGISATPRTLVVIGRSASLTEEHRRTLSVMQGQRPRLSITTYDDIIDRARANLERHFGPLSLRAQNLKIYFYRDDGTAG